MTDKQREALKIVTNAIHSSNLSIEDAIIIIEAITDNNVVYYPYYSPSLTQSQPPLYKNYEITCQNN